MTSRSHSIEPTTIPGAQPRSGWKRRLDRCVTEIVMLSGVWTLVVGSGWILEWILSPGIDGPLEARRLAGRAALGLVLVVAGLGAAAFGIERSASVRALRAQSWLPRPLDRQGVQAQESERDNKEPKIL